MCLDEVCLIGLLCSLTGFILRWGGEQNPLHLIYRPICQISVHSFSRVSESRGLLRSLEPSWSVYSWLHSLFYFILLSSSELCHPGICWTRQSADGPCPLQFLSKAMVSFLTVLTDIHFSGILRSKGMSSVCHRQQEVLSFERRSWSYNIRSR